MYCNEACFFKNSFTHFSIYTAHVSFIKLSITLNSALEVNLAKFIFCIVQWSICKYIRNKSFIEWVWDIQDFWKRHYDFELEIDGLYLTSRLVHSLFWCHNSNKNEVHSNNLSSINTTTLFKIYESKKVMLHFLYWKINTSY